MAAAERDIEGIWYSMAANDPAIPNRNFHNILNRVDAHKDINSQSGVASYKPYFEQSLNGIIPPDTPGQSSFTSSGHLKALEHRVIPVDPDKNNNRWGTTQAIKLKILKRKKDIGFKSFPAELSCYKFPFVDAAFNINDWLEDPLNPGLNITPFDTLGSTIDPGGRAPGTSVPSVNTPIRIELTPFGFPGCVFEGVWISNDQADIQITTPQFILQMRINKKGDCSSVNFTNTGGVNYGYPTSDFGGIDNANIFVKGNTVKHNFFSDLTLGGNYRDQWAMAYILCKELGDTIQVILIWMLLNNNAQYGFEGTVENTVVFTPDIPFACRCISLNVPCILLADTSKADQAAAAALGGNYSSVYLFPGQTDPAKIKVNINIQRVKAAIKQNSDIKYKFNQYILKQRGNEEYNQEFIDKVNEFIDTLNRLLLAVNCDEDNETINRVVCKLSCMDIFTSRGPSSTLTSIIPNWHEPSEIIACIHIHPGYPERDADIISVSNMQFKSFIDPPSNTNITFSVALQRSQVRRKGGNNIKKYVGGSEVFNNLPREIAAEEMYAILFPMLEYYQEDITAAYIIEAYCLYIYNNYLGTEEEVNSFEELSTYFQEIKKEQMRKKEIRDELHNLKLQLTKAKKSKNAKSIKKLENEIKALEQKIQMTKISMDRQEIFSKRRNKSIQQLNYTIFKKGAIEFGHSVSLFKGSRIGSSKELAGKHLSVWQHFQEFKSYIEENLRKQFTSPPGIPDGIPDNSLDNVPYFSPDKVSNDLYQTILEWVDKPRLSPPQKKEEAPVRVAFPFPTQWKYQQQQPQPQQTFVPTGDSSSQPHYLSLFTKVEQSPPIPGRGGSSKRRSTLNHFLRIKTIDNNITNTKSNKNTHNKKLKNTHKLNKKLNKKTRKGKKTHRKTYKKK